MVNKVTLIGRVGKDPEVRRLENGIAVAKFSVATNENYKDKSGEWVTLTEWHDIVVWRLLAERAEQQLKKGKLVYVDGKLTHRKWQAEDGSNRYSTEVVANTFRLLEKREEGSGGFTSNFPGGENVPPAKEYEKAAAAGTATTPAAAETATPKTAAPASKEEAEDDLPF